jgi:CpeT/CpcT family (DUF1001)
MLFWRGSKSSKIEVGGIMRQLGRAVVSVAGIAMAVAASTSAYALGPIPPVEQSITIEKFANWWVGSFSNERQVNTDRLQNEPDYPESVRLLRNMRVQRLNAPAIGPLVLYLEEIKTDQPDKAHRQRVMTFNWKAETGEIEVEQLFFSTELAYDRHFIPASDVEKMKRSDFTREPGCDLFFKWDEARQRFKGGMRARACQYDHPTSGPVYAEFDMILDANRLWYRDRSIKRGDGTIRGEIDGFSWLRFDRLADVAALANGDRISKRAMLARMPNTARMEGTWQGTFRRYDANGVLNQTLASNVIVRFLEDGNAFDYSQTNITREGDGPEQRIESFGKWDVDRLRFSNARLDGWAMDVAQDPTGLTSIFVMNFKDGSGMTVSEIVSLSPDGRSRSRATQYLVGGKVVRRTLIDEVKVGP